MFRGYMPEWLYKALPALYVLSGLATILVLRDGMAVFSGMMLISAGVAVWFMRRRSGEPVRDVPRRAEEPSGIAPRQGFVELVWKREYECGHKTIDLQHRGLFAIANLLFDAIVNESKAEVANLLDDLVNDVKLHFQTEERLLTAGNLDPAGAHAALHKQLLDKAGILVGQYLEGKVDAGDLISFVAYDLVAQHITREDAKWAQIAKLV